MITNYIHIMRAGHLKEMMELHVYLAYLANDAVKAINNTVSVIYHRHSQQGGSQGQDSEHSDKQGSHTDGIERDSLRAHRLRGRHRADRAQRAQGDGPRALRAPEPRDRARRRDEEGLPKQAQVECTQAREAPKAHLGLSERVSRTIDCPFESGVANITPSCSSFALSATSSINVFQTLMRRLELPSSHTSSTAGGASSTCAERLRLSHAAAPTSDGMIAWIPESSAGLSDDLPCDTAAFSFEASRARLPCSIRT